MPNIPATPTVPEPVLFYVKVDGEIAVLAKDAAQAVATVQHLGSFELAEHVGVADIEVATRMPQQPAKARLVPYVADGVEPGHWANMPTEAIVKDILARRNPGPEV